MQQHGFNNLIRTPTGSASTRSCTVTTSLLLQVSSATHVDPNGSADHHYHCVSHPPTKKRSKKHHKLKAELLPSRHSLPLFCQWIFFQKPQTLPPPYRITDPCTCASSVALATVDLLSPHPKQLMTNHILFVAH